MKIAESERLPTVQEASLATIAIFAVLISGCLFLKLPAQVSLFITVMISCIFAFYLGYSWTQVEQMIQNGLNAGLMALLLNLCIGMLIAVLCASGTIPYLICLGLEHISARFFLLTAFLLCSVFSSCVGSSYTTAGTIGVALFGISTAMGHKPEAVCGAILAGCFVGEKLSPISEAVNVSSACAGAEVSAHIKSMCYVILPSVGIVAAGYLAAGCRTAAASAEQSSLMELKSVFQTLFWLHPALLLTIVIILLMIIKRFPVLITLVAGIVVSSLFCMMFQHMSPYTVADILVNGFSAQTGNEAANQILQKGGLNSMTGVVTIILCGMPLGGILEGTKTLEVMIRSAERFVQTAPRVMTASVFISMATAGMTGSNYPAYMLTSAAFRDSYDRLGLDRSMLSRACDMAGFCGVFLPWTTTGMFMSSLFGMPVSAYAPYYFFGYLVPICTIVCSCSGWGICYLEAIRREDGKKSTRQQK